MPTEVLDPTWIDHFVRGIGFLGIIAGVGVIVVALYRILDRI
jgi:hypothetical protein